MNLAEVFLLARRAGTNPSRVGPALRRRMERRASDRRASRMLQEWQQRASRYGGVADLIEPYVVRRRVCGFDIQCLVATSAARQWYDHLELYTDLALIQQLKMIRPGDVVFDLGAHQGFYSLVLARMAGRRGRVYSFEPFALNADLARFNARLNHLPIEVFQVGLSNRRGPSQASFALHRIASVGGADMQSVSLDTLDSYAHLRPDFLKIDIEGAELDALGAAGEVLALRPNIHLEVHYDYYPAFGRRLEELYDVLPWHDYHAYIAHPGRPVEVFDRSTKIENYCAVFLLREPPTTRISLAPS